MITHPPAYNIALRPYYVHMTAAQDARNDKLAAAYLLDYIENAPPVCDDGWTALRLNQLYEVLSPFVPQRPVYNALQWLEADGLIETRFDPKNKLNRTKQYRLRESEVQKRIDCWTAQNQTLNYAQRCISSIYAQPQNMHNDGVKDVTEVHAGSSVLNSNTPIQQDMKVSNHYETTMATIHVLLCVEVFPVVGKKPAPKSATDSTGWEWNKKRLGRPGRQLATMYAWQQATGYGMLPVKGDRLVFVDIDRPEFERELFAALPRLKDTYRQQRGSHSCLAVRLPYTLESRFEIDDAQGEIASIRNHNSYQVGAGSLHPSGERYEVTNMVAPVDLTPDEARVMLDMFTGKTAKKVTQPVKPTMVVSKPADPIAADQNLKKWARNGQEQALRQLSSATAGMFNKTLYKTACRLANLAKVTGESPEQLHDLLWAVCEQAGYVRRDGGSQTWSTIRSGIRTGEQLPLNVPERKAKQGKAS